jgi:uncharacterized membrane protein (DUF106 family)
VIDGLVRVLVWLNSAANALARPLLAPIGDLPGWLSATIVAVLTGVIMLVVFKYTSNQKAIKRVRDDINANLLALKLFKDSAAVSLRAQGRILISACRLMFLAVVPMLAMMVPVCLILTQLALWYQNRPLQLGEETVVTLKLNPEHASSWPDVSLTPTSAVEVLLGPVRVISRKEICWQIKARSTGYHRLEFRVGNETAVKEIAISDAVMRVSKLRPRWQWSEILLNPSEEPFRPDSPVQSIEIAYPGRSSWTSGTDSWVVYWFVVSFVAALCFRRALNVNL